MSAAQERIPARPLSRPLSRRRTAALRLARARSAGGLRCPPARPGPARTPRTLTVAIKKRKGTTGCRPEEGRSSRIALQRGGAIACPLPRPHGFPSRLQRGVLRFHTCAITCLRLFCTSSPHLQRIRSKRTAPPGHPPPAASSSSSARHPQALARSAPPGDPGRGPAAGHLPYRRAPPIPPGTSRTASRPAAASPGQPSPPFPPAPPPRYLRCRRRPGGESPSRLPSGANGRRARQRRPPPRGPRRCGEVGGGGRTAGVVTCVFLNSSLISIDNRQKRAAEEAPAPCPILCPLPSSALRRHQNSFRNLYEIPELAAGRAAAFGC